MGKKLTIKELEQRLKSSDAATQSRARIALSQRDDIPLETLECWLIDSNTYVAQTALNICKNRAEAESTGFHVPLPVIQRWLQRPIDTMRLAAMFVCSGRKDIPLDIIEKGLRDSNYTIVRAAVNVLQNYGDISPEVIGRWFKDANPNIRKASMVACSHIKDWNDVPLSLIARGLKDSDKDVRWAAEGFFKNRKAIPIDVIEKWLYSAESRIREIAIQVCSDYGSTDALWGVIERGLRDPDEDVADAAHCFCENRNDIPVDVIRRWSLDFNANVRVAAFESCQCRDDIPLEVINRGIHDNDISVSYAARKACMSRKDIPLMNLMEWAEDNSPGVRILCMNLCERRGDAWECIEKGLDDPIDAVREAARQACLSA